MKSPSCTMDSTFSKWKIFFHHLPGGVWTRGRNFNWEDLSLKTSKSFSYIRYISHIYHIYIIYIYMVSKIPMNKMSLVGLGGGADHIYIYIYKYYIWNLYDSCSVGSLGRFVTGTRERLDPFLAVSLKDWRSLKDCSRKIVA